jgi:DNA-directed RNA polymerase subunit M/transcription elongation factor TFIIS
MSFEEFENNCDINLNSFLKKKSNRLKIATILWKMAKQDYNYANYLCFEIYSDYLCTFKLSDVIENIKNKKLGWQNPIFESYNLKQKEYDDFLTKPPDVEEGVIECHKCGSKKTYSFSKQTRRADESATVFVRCSNCHNTFKF